MAPRRPDAGLDEALSHLEAGRKAAAEESCLRVLERDHANPEALSFLGLLRLRDGRAQEAAELLRTSLGQRPDQPRAWLHLGVALRGLGDEAGAEAAYRRCLEQEPEVPEAHYNLGRSLARSHPEEAAVHLRQAARLRPGWPEAENALGLLALRDGALDAAVDAFRRAAEAAPGWAIPHLNLGELELARVDPVAALDAFDRALERQPDSVRAHCNRAYTLLQLGDFEAGWQELEWRFGAGAATPARSGYDAPVWRGEPFPGRTLVVWMEQGLGDALQFVRFLPGVAARGGRVWLQTAPQLAGLLRTCDGIDRVLVGDPAPEEVDLQLPLLSLPRVLGTRLATLPSRVPYLAAPEPPPRRAHLALAAARDRKVGVVWRSGTLDPEGARRDLDPASLGGLLEAPGVDWFALQYEEPVRSFVPDLPSRISDRLTDLAHDLGDFASTAAVIEELDLVVTVDTAMAHLAGALGRPVWVLLPRVADWRWLSAREDSPWYPSMRLYRQEAPGRWDETIRRVVSDLAATR